MIDLLKIASKPQYTKTTTKNKFRLIYKFYIHTTKWHDIDQNPLLLNQCINMSFETSCIRHRLYEVCAYGGYEILEWWLVVANFGPQSTKKFEGNSVPLRGAGTEVKDMMHLRKVCCTRRRTIDITI